ncbi:MAG: hexokinase [Firmicutes bacterium]|nr:hexokinase [Bacillota bacterium]
MEVSNKLINMFTVTCQDISVISDAFSKEMVLGLAGEKSTLKMLPSFLAMPSGMETGSFLALDFGGTNVRAEGIKLLGAGKWAINGRKAIPLKSLEGQYDYISAETPAEDLFDFLAKIVTSVMEPGNTYALGYTFSFACSQASVSRAKLISWTKEIKTAGVEGKEVGALLKEALDRQGANSVTPVAIINDTVGTLLTAAYIDGSADIGAICGTGYNSCYFDSTTGMIINMESGNFAALPINVYDEQLDAMSEKPGTQRLEKLVAGKYLGELVRLVAVDLLGIKAEPYSLTSEDMAVLVTLDYYENPVLTNLTAYEIKIVRDIARMVVERAARLVAATFLGVLNHIDAELKEKHIIAIDGSLYEKMPNYKEAVNKAINEMLGEKAVNIKLELVKDGSGVGAAVAAASALLAENNY